MHLRSLIAAAAALSAVLLVAAPAAGQDREPRIDEIQMNGRAATRGPLGAVLVAKGRNFHVCPPQPETEEGAPPEECRHEEVEVRVGSTECMLLDANAEYVTFIVPQFGVRPGRARIRIETENGSARAEFELVDPARWDNEADQQAQGATESGGTVQPDTEVEIRRQFKITRFEIKRDGGANRFEIEGLAGKVPDGFAIDAVLKFDGREIAAHKTRIRGGGFEVSFGPYTEQLLFGNYSVTLLFELGKQSRVRARRFNRDLSDAEKQVYDRIERREFLTVGTEQEIDDQQQVLRQHYLELTQGCQGLLNEFERAYAVAARVFFKAPGSASYDEAEYSAYLQRMGFAETADELQEIRRDTRFATGSGHFKPKGYERWAEEEFLPRLAELYEEHEDFKSRYIASLNERADLLSDYCVSIVLALFQDWSRAAYDRAKIDVPDTVAVAPINPIRAPTVSKQFFNAQRRMLLRVVGLEDVVDAEDREADEED